MTNEQIKQPMLPYYVYVLLNPLDKNKPFYVGKGMGQRVSQHFIDVERKLRKESNEEQFENIANEKLKIINEIRKSNKRPLELIIGRFETEDEAFAVESVLIHFVFGYENLTNIAGGHGRKLIRTKTDFESVLSTATSQEVIEKRLGIDIERIFNMRDGSFKNEKIRKLMEANAYDWLSILQDELTSNNFDWRDFSAPGERRFHPSESNGYLAVIIRIGTIDFNVQFTATKRMSIQVIYTESSKSQSSLVQLKRIKSKLGLFLSPSKANEKYSWLEEKVTYKDFSSLIKRLKELRDAINSENSID